MDSSPQTESKSRPPMSKRWTFAILILAFLFVLMPFLFWNATWFGRPLTDDQIAHALSDRSHPREIQHALNQIELRIEAGNPSAHRWYPQIVQLATDPIDEIRVTDAWVMGQDNKAPEFHAALLKMLADPNPMVERNAALSLVRFGDDSGHAQIIAMLRPYAMASPFAGKLETRLKPGEVVNPGTLIGHVESEGQSREVRAEVPGTLARWLVADGSAVTAGQPIVTLDPSDSMVWEALRALYLVGKSEDLPDVQRYARGGEGVSQQIMQQAQSTAQAIRSRSAS
jgi:biotin carboxyl carrier protein